VPVDGEPGSILRGGEFYSPVQARLRTDEVLLSELRQPCSRRVPRHEHELAYVTVVLNGDYLEGDRGKLDELRPFTAVFNPVGTAHSTVIGPSGASFFTLEFRDQTLAPLGLRLPTATTFDRGAGAMLWPGLRLYSAFKTQTADSLRDSLSCSLTTDSLTLEACILEIAGAIAGFDAPEKSAPRWFHRVKERLHADFREHLRIRDLARDAGVHPVHLARVFRKIENRTPGDYQQRLQVRAACELLRDPEWPLAAIAAECGFADQSHLTRTFRRMTGTTPARFRRAISLRLPSPQTRAAQKGAPQESGAPETFGDRITVPQSS
jgi:AraC family transcriptional regulator